MPAEPPDDLGSLAIPPELAVALDAVRSRLGGFGRRFVYLAAVPSTNDVAARLAASGAAEGTVVLADAQTAGRGRLGRAWFSPPGTGLYVSVVFRPPSRQDGCGGAGPPSPTPDADGYGGVAPTSLSIAAAVALADGIREATGLEPEIKWPNDLLVGRRKLAGILAEASAVSGRLDHVILGFGINVAAGSWPADIVLRATAIELELGRPVDRFVVLARVLARLAETREDLRRGGFGVILSRWRRLSPSSTGRAVHWSTAAGVRRGTTAGIDDDGALIVRTSGGLERVVAGEIVWD